MNESIVFSRAEVRHIPQLKELWSRCFTEDSQEAIEAFYDTLFSSMVCLIGAVGDRPVTMLHLLPAKACIHAEAFPVRYLYAGCTHPDFRHRGYYAGLLQFAQTCVTEMGEYGIYLHPATPQLVPMYAQFGYTEAIVSGSPQRFQGNEKPLTLKAADYARLRRDHLLQSDYDFVYFEPDPIVSGIFIANLFREGAQLYSTDDAVLLVKDNNILDSLPPMTKTHSAAMWVETNENRRLSAAMKAYGGYTALLGE